MRKLAVVLVCALATGCAGGGRDALPPVAGLSFCDSSPFVGAIEIGELTGAAYRDNNLWQSTVSNEVAGEIIAEYLDASDLLAESGGRYRMDVTFISTTPPTAALDMTAGSRIQYNLVEQATGELAFFDNIEAFHTQPFGSAIVGARRSVLASEGAVRENVRTMVEKLQALDAGDGCAG